VAKGVLVDADPEKIEQWRTAARARGLPLATWMRQIANEECERQAALILYKIRVERPHEVNAVVEELLRNRALNNCPKRKAHKPGTVCPECQLVP